MLAAVIIGFLFSIKANPGAARRARIRAREARPVEPEAGWVVLVLFHIKDRHPFPFVTIIPVWVFLP